MQNDLAIVILAAGKGTRMQSRKQKILHEVGGKPMVEHVFNAARAVSAAPPTLVISPDEQDVQQMFGDHAQYVVQQQPLGTGHATAVTADLLRGRSKQVIVTYGDMPLVRAETLQRLATCQQQSGAAVVVLTVDGEPTSSFGRIVRDESGRVVEIIEVANARRHENAAALLAIRELNVGIYCFDADILWRHVGSLPVRQARSGQEYYLTDMVETAVQHGRPVEAVSVAEADEALGAGTRRELALVERAFRRRTVNHWLENGVTIVAPEQTYIDVDVTIGPDTVIWPNSFLQDGTQIGADCAIGPNVIVRNSTVGDRCRLEQSRIVGQAIADDTVVVD